MGNSETRNVVLRFLWNLTRLAYLAEYPVEGAGTTLGPMCCNCSRDFGEIFEVLVLGMSDWVLGREMDAFLNLLLERLRTGPEWSDLDIDSILFSLPVSSMSLGPMLNRKEPRRTGIAAFRREFAGT